MTRPANDCRARLRAAIVVAAAAWAAGCGGAPATHAEPDDVQAVDAREETPPWPPTPADLRWLEGRWVGATADGGCVLETWLSSASGTRWGARVEVRGAETTRRLMRIVDATEPMRLIVTDPRGQTVTYALVSRALGRVAFVRADGGGAHLAYRRSRDDPDVMRVAELARDGAEPASMTLRRAADGSACPTLPGPSTSGRASP